MTPTRVSVWGFQTSSVIQLLISFVIMPFGDNSRLGIAEDTFEISCFGEVEHLLRLMSGAERNICCFSQEESGVRSQEGLNEPAKH